jgi:predicted metalloprotease with PDZ domain
LYCNDLTVRTNYVDQELALLHGAATFLSIFSDIPAQYEVMLELPPGWCGAWSGMPGNGTHFLATDYDTLVDSPIVAGNPAIQQFDVDGKPHFLLNFGDTSLWDLSGATRDVEKIVREHYRMWSDLPYEKYLFLNLLTGGRGALEHRNSVVLTADRFTMTKRAAYVSWLDLVSHEYFHTWNVKQLRPAELGPFDYENEVYTRNLWIAEGFTEYYTALGVRRAGITSDEEFLGSNRSSDPRKEPASISGLIEKLQSTPGRLEQPVSLASFDAWIKLYRPDENSLNSTISYYTKGAVIAWLLDARIRAATHDTRSLDDVMRLARQRFGGAVGFTSDDFRNTAEEVAGCNLNEWFHYVADSTGELDYTEALTWFGLHFKPPEPRPGVARKSWLGISTKHDRGRLIVTQVLRGTPAWNAGISADDEILGLDGYRVRPEQWEQRLEAYPANREVSLLVSHRERLVTIPVRVGEEPEIQWRVAIDPEATTDQARHFASWVAGDGKRALRNDH